jgi:hypothetical protein
MTGTYPQQSHPQPHPLPQLSPHWQFSQLQVGFPQLQFFSWRSAVFLFCVFIEKMFLLMQR